ncbi:MAG: 2-C-methyl-D-erythritol 2,4-cyclodiphosphate synthase [Candidatus Syntrophosphaera sp.]|nr:2-C-methyl-D-erythritol 2,4-cyclodiphosphate synthase [Candidatus Syntrophosphaera sp.]
MRIGLGYDVHRLVPDRKLVLGGVEIPYERGLEGHSDADVLIHSVIDALLGALSLGDIGSHFPDNDPAYKDIDSRFLLRRAFSLIAARQFKLNNLDCTVCASAPKLQPFIGQMRANLAEDLKCPVGLISVKATTEEGLGVSGNGEGISCYCVVLVEQT